MSDLSLETLHRASAYLIDADEPELASEIDKAILFLSPVLPDETEETLASLKISSQYAGPTKPIIDLIKRLRVAKRRLVELDEDAADRDDNAAITKAITTLSPVLHLSHKLQRGRLVMSNQTDMEWISVKDRLPEEGQEVLFYWPPDANGNGEEINVDYIEDENKPLDWLHVPTHWMPLPEPPEDNHE